MDIEFKTYQAAIDALKEHPAFTYAALQALRLAPDADSKTRLKSIIAASVGSQTDLMEILGLNSESLADFYTDTLPPHLSTTDTIDTFLNKFGSPAATAAPAAVADYTSSLMDLPEQTSDTPAPIPDSPAASPILLAPAADYASSLMDLPEQPPVGDLIPDFSPNRPSPAKKETPADSDTQTLTESFAKILIKNRNYSKALEIIQELYLKNPEKSIYFADQIRFLKKLIINSNKARN